MEQIVLDGSLMQQRVLPQGSTRLFERSCSHRFFVILTSFPTKAAAILRLRCRVIQHQFLQAVFLHRTEKEKPAAGKTDYWRDFWRRRWDSNPRTLADQTISSRSRYDHFDTSPYMTASLLLRMEKSLVYYDTTSWKRQGETFRFLVVKKVHRSGLPLRWTDRANRFVLIHTHSSKRISYPASPMPLCRARCCRLALPTLAPAQDAQDSPAADHQHPCP